MTRRLLILFATLAAGLSLIWALPQSPTRSSALPGSTVRDTNNWELPTIVGLWSGGAPLPASEKEIEVLAKDTLFKKRAYTRQGLDMADPNPRHSMEQIEVSIVTSGSDMGNSIHRPERCLRAQGFTINTEETVMLKIAGKPMKVRKLHCTKPWQDPQTGKSGAFENVTYYWFVGCDSITNSHWERTYVDMRDRIMKGYDQQWAYASVSILLDRHPVLLASRYDEMRKSIQRRLDNKKMTADEAILALAFIRSVDERYMSQEAPEAESLVATQEQKAIDAFLAGDAEKKTSCPASIKELFAETRVMRNKDDAAVTRLVDDTKPDSNGLTDADRLLRPFIEDLSKEIIDRRAITAWNAVEKGKP